MQLKYSKVNLKIRKCQVNPEVCAVIEKEGYSWHTEFPDDVKDFLNYLWSRAK